MKFFVDCPLGVDQDISKFLKLSKEHENLEFAYREIRQELSFLSNLKHKNLAKLCGVWTTPYICLVLELAKQSLRGVFKEYTECSVTLEPVTMRITALQVCIPAMGGARDHESYQSCMHAYIRTYVCTDVRMDGQTDGRTNGHKHVRIHTQYSCHTAWGGSSQLVTLH